MNKVIFKISIIFSILIFSYVELSKTTSADGELLWTQTYNLGENRAIIDTAVASDESGVYGSGYWQKGGGVNGYPYFWRVEKRNANTGNLEWERIEDFGDYSNASAITYDENFLYVAGEAGCYAGSWDCYWRIEKLDRLTGNLIWESIVDFGARRHVVSSVEIKDNKINIYGSQNMGFAFYCRVASLELSSGNEISRLEFNDDILMCNSGKQDNSGNYYVAGAKIIPSGGPVYGIIKKFQSNGSLLWSDLNPVNRSISFLGGLDNANLYTFKSQGSNVLTLDAFLEKYDINSGQLLWSHSLGTIGSPLLFNAFIIGDLSQNNEITNNLYVGFSYGPCSGLGGCTNYKIQKRSSSSGELLFEYMNNVGFLATFDIFSSASSKHLVVSSGVPVSGMFLTYRSKIDKFALAVDLPNLTSGAVTPSTNVVRKGSGFDISSLVTNTTGLAVSTTFTDNFTYRWGLFGGWSDFTGNQVVHANLGAGASINDSVTISSTYVDQTGNLYIQHCTDAVPVSGVVTETSEADNCSVSGSIKVIDGDLSTDKTAINGGETVNLTWSTSGSPTACTVSGGTDTWSTLSGTNQPTSALYANRTYTLVCDGILLDAVSITVDVSPILTVSKRTVEVNDTIDLSWDTNNGAEQTCTLSGGTVAGNPLNPSIGDPNTGTLTNVTVLARTTYTLSCPDLGGGPNLTFTQTVDIVPKGTET